MMVYAISVNAQDLLIEDFENVSSVWETVSCYSDVRDNAFKQGLNLSGKVLYIVRAPGCDNWSGAIYTPSEPIRGYSYVHIYMYRTNGNKPNLKISENAPSGGSTDLEPVNSIVANEWQDVVFDISAFSQVDFLMIMADRTAITNDAEIYCDQILLSNDAAPRTAVLQPAEQDPSEPISGEVDSEGYRLMWSDEFDGTALDRNAWTTEIGTGDNGWGNWEQQYYTDDAITVEDGKLVITATKRDYQGSHYTSGRMISRDKMYFTYGKVVASIKFPDLANGLWPAFWMMGNDITSVGWPRCGETDIVEMGNATGISNGTQDRYFNGASHWGENWPQASTANAQNAPYAITDGNYHTFTCIWTPTQISMYLDRDIYPNVEPYHTLDISDHSGQLWTAGTYFNKPNFLLFNMAVGGQFTGLNANAITALNNGPRSMYVDYVRVYQRGDEGETLHKPNSQTALRDISADKDVDRIEWYDMQGRRIEPATKGLFIKKTIFTDGTMRADKVLFNH